MSAAARNPYLPLAAEVVERVEEAPDVYTLRIRLRDGSERAAYRFAPGQFNMLYLFGVGEVPISISSDPDQHELVDHTIRAVGRVTEGLVRLDPGARLGLRGPFGTGWPFDVAHGRALLMITGGLGCAPTNSAIEYAIKRRSQYGPITIAHGVKRPQDLIYGARFAAWEKAPDTRVLLSADRPDPKWRGRTGLVTALLDEIDPNLIREAFTLMCGPEPMMRSVAENLLKRGAALERIYLSLERNMQCALGHCGNCQFGKEFLCKDGPVFPYARVRALLPVGGY
jgi:NAD(P)H-flavin reductase